jgi:hypothetical protein
VYDIWKRLELKKSKTAGAGEKFSGKPKKDKENGLEGD